MLNLNVLLLLEPNYILSKFLTNSRFLCNNARNVWFVMFCLCHVLVPCFEPTTKLSRHFLSMLHTTMHFQGILSDMWTICVFGWDVILLALWTYLTAFCTKWTSCLKNSKHTKSQERVVPRWFSGNGLMERERKNYSTEISKVLSGEFFTHWLTALIRN